MCCSRAVAAIIIFHFSLDTLTRSLCSRTQASRGVTVVPVVLGVALTSITEAEFSLAGLCAILISTAGQAFQGVAAKRLMREREVGKGELFAMAALHAFLMLVPLSILLDVWRIRRSPLNPNQSTRLIKWLLLNGAASYVNQYSGLSVLDAMSSPLSHALANVMKRATVITCAMIYQAKPVTPLHVCGVALSVFGALGYQHLDKCDKSNVLSLGDERSAYELVPLREGGMKDGGGGGGRGEGAEMSGALSNTSSLHSSPLSQSPPPSPILPPLTSEGAGGSPSRRVSR